MLKGPFEVTQDGQTINNVDGMVIAKSEFASEVVEALNSWWESEGADGYDDGGEGSDE